MLNRLLLLLGALGLLVMSATAQGTVPAPTPPVRTIVVTGTAEREVSPDVSLVVFAVVTQAEVVSRAVSENNTISNRVMEAIRRLNIRNLTLRTLGFEVTPIYEQPAPNVPLPRPQRIVAYNVTNRVEARIPEPRRGELSTVVGRVLDAGLAAGANRVDSVSFMLDDDKAIQRELLAEATRDARETAVAMARAAGVNLGPLMTLSATPFYRQPPMPYLARAADTAQGVPIVAGTLTVQASVSAVYEIR